MIIVLSDTVLRGRTTVNRNHDVILVNLVKLMPYDRIRYERRRWERVASCGCNFSYFVAIEVYIIQVNDQASFKLLTVLVMMQL